MPNIGLLIFEILVVGILFGDISGWKTTELKEMQIREYFLIFNLVDVAIVLHSFLFWEFVFSVKELVPCVYRQPTAAEMSPDLACQSGEQTELLGKREHRLKKDTWFPAGNISSCEPGEKMFLQPIWITLDSLAIRIKHRSQHKGAACPSLLF